MYDAKQSIEAFLSATAARQPTPGGGSVTALVGALAAAIGEMVVNYSIGKKGSEIYEAELRPVVAELTRARNLLLDFMVEDQGVYEAMVRARKMPADAPDRQAAIDAALLACIRVPEAMAATGVAILDLSDRIVNFVNFHLLSDLAVCSDLAMATVRCAIYNVRVNMAELKDPDDRRRIESQISQLLTHAAKVIQRVSPRIWDRHAHGM